MATKRMNVLIYSGPGSTIESVRHCLYSLRRLLSPNYTVGTISGETIIKEPWGSSCALLVFPGGADLGYCRTLEGKGNRRIRQYVNLGGSYLGLCAGGYYGSKRCEFEVGNEDMEIAGDRELEFFPGVCRGSAFPGFVYKSEVGTHASKLKIETGSFTCVGSMLPDVFRSYSNGGGVFVDASMHRHRGVEILATYEEMLQVDAGKDAAAIVYCKVGDGGAILTGPHPEFASVNINKHIKGMKSTVLDALTEDDDARVAFLKACLRKLKLRVDEEEQAVPALTSIHFSSVESSDMTKVLASMDIIKTSDGELYIRGEQDVFQLHKPSSAWAMGRLTKEVLDTLPAVDKPASKLNKDPDDFGEVVQNIIMHENAVPTGKETPHFDHAAYYTNLKAYNSSVGNSDSTHLHFGRYLMYGEVITSTSTLLEKNHRLTTHLPSGTTLTATTQLSGRGRGSNIWISPPGSLMFSTILTHPLTLNVTAPIVFIQYLAAIAVAEGVQSYDLTPASPPHRRSPYGRLPIKLKWPNDIYALDPSQPNADPTLPSSYTKIGGILVNSSYSGGDYTLIVGIGLNVSNAAPTTSLNVILGALNNSSSANKQPPLAPFTLEKLLARILTTFSALYATFRRSGFAGEIEELYYKHWLHSGQVVVLETEGGAQTRIKGVTRDWGLLLAEEVIEGRGAGKMFALQSDNNSFDFFKGLIKRKV